MSLKSIGCRLVQTAVVLGVTLLCTGCLGGQELADRAMVTALGVDRHPTQEGYLLTFSHYDQKPETGQSLTIVAGDTVSQGVINGSVSLGKELFLGSLQLLILGEELTPIQRQNVAEHFYSIYKISPKLTVASADTALGILTAAEGDTQRLVQAISDGEEAGETIAANLESLHTAISSDNQTGQSVLLPFLSPKPALTTGDENASLSLESLFPPVQPEDNASAQTQEASSPQSENGESSQDSGSHSAQEESTSGGGQQKTPEIATDWLSGGRLLTAQEAPVALSPQTLRGLCWLAGRQQGAELSIPIQQGLTATAVSLKVEEKNELSQVGDAQVLTFNVEARFRLLEGAYILDDAGMQELSNAFAATMRRQIQNALSDTLRQGRDVLSLYHRLGRVVPPKQWPAFLENCGFAVNVSVTLAPE